MQDKAECAIFLCLLKFDTMTPPLKLRGFDVYWIVSLCFWYYSHARQERMCNVFVPYTMDIYDIIYECLIIANESDIVIYQVSKNQWNLKSPA